MCELIERDFGFPKLRELVRLYGEGLDTPDAVRRALGIEPEEFDRRFLQYARDYVSAYKLLPPPSAEAIARLRTRLRKDKDDADGWALLAAGQTARGDIAAALQSVGKLAELRPDSPRAATLRALIAFRQQRTDQAIPFAEQAIAGGDDTFDLRMAMAEHYAKLKDFESAKEHLRAAIGLFPVAPDNESPRLRLAQLLMGEGEGQLGAAMKLLEEQVAVSEDDFVARAKLAGWYRDLGRTDDELRTLLEMRDIVPLPNGPWNREGCAGLHERIAQLELERKAYPEAEVAARMAAEVAGMQLRKGESLPLDDVRRAELLALHAETLQLLGRNDDAKRRAEEALRLDPANDHAGVLLEKLK